MTDQFRDGKVPASVGIKRMVDAARDRLPTRAGGWQIAAREWAEVPDVPSRQTERKDGQPYRYLAIRVRQPQGPLFGDGHAVKHCAAVTNDGETDGQALLVWQR